MKRVGIRELRQNASALLRLVEAGATVEITDRGRPVAILSPVPSGGPLERLRESGQSVPAQRAIEDLAPPLVAPSDISVSEVLQDQREERFAPKSPAERP